MHWIFYPEEWERGNIVINDNILEAEITKWIEEYNAEYPDSPLWEILYFCQDRRENNRQDGVVTTVPIVIVTTKKWESLTFDLFPNKSQELIKLCGMVHTTQYVKEASKTIVEDWKKVA